MASIRDFEKLDVWQMARKLANAIYASSSSGAFARDFVLRDQIRRAAVSIISNIAEGFERGGNTEPETRNPKPVSRQAGFSIVAAIFLVVVLALLGAFIVSVTGLQVSIHQLDILGARAYQGARAGVEWGVYQVLDPNNTINAASCAAPNMPVCPGGGGTTDLAAGSLAGSLAPFTVTVRCTRTTATEGNRDVWVYELRVDACNEPTGTSCPNTVTPAPGYVSRQITTVLSKCKDATAAPPRCACG